ncbi:hypothetical protein NIES4101_27270 (plasmid) [Calothrix sp. NIES-4101]|nr:hypothetical protein NIES4101_27270 [Calothrix sp. NIES-4101]
MSWLLLPRVNPGKLTGKLKRCAIRLPGFYGILSEIVHSVVVSNKTYVSDVCGVVFMFRYHRLLLLLALIATPLVSVLPSQKVLAQDFDGDRVTDEVLSWDQSTGIWTIRTARGNLTVQWGTRGDIPVPADYNGDGITEIAVWRPSDGNWYISSRNLSWVNRDGSERIVQWGTRGDIPVQSDYNTSRPGTEIAVWRPSNGNWYISSRNLSWANRDGSERIVQWGSKSDTPVPSDYNTSRPGTEIAVYKKSTGTCYISTENRSWDTRGEAVTINQLENCGR